MRGDLPDLEHDVDNLKVEVMVAIEFQILSPNFKVFKKIDAVKTYLFRLFGVYVINDLIYSIMSTPNKHQ